MPAPSGDGKADYVCIRYFPFAGFVDRLLCKPDNFCSPKLLDVFNICTFSKNDFQNWGKIQNFSKKFADRLITPVCDMSLWMQPLLCCNMSDTIFWRKRRTRAPGTSALTEVFLPPFTAILCGLRTVYSAKLRGILSCILCNLHVNLDLMDSMARVILPSSSSGTPYIVRSLPICAISFLLDPPAVDPSGHPTSYRKLCPISIVVHLLAV